MIYSVFDAKSGLYDYFENGEQLAVNADLPVPTLPSPTNGVGVSAIHAARPLPADARPVGRGWHARGIIAQPQSSAAGLGTVPTAGETWQWTVGGGWKWIAGGAVAIWLLRKV